MRILHKSQQHILNTLLLKNNFLALIQGFSFNTLTEHIFSTLEVLNEISNDIARRLD